MSAAEPSRTRGPGLGMTMSLGVLAMFAPFSTDTIFPAFAAMGVQFGADSTQMQQVTSVYLIALALMSIFHGAISDAVGRRSVMLVAAAAYTLASVGCALATSLPMLLVFRFGQGMFAGAGMIITRTIVRDLYSGPPAQKLMAQIMMMLGLGPALAPIIGGLLLGVGGWPIIFWFLTGYGVLAFVASWALPETLPADQRQPLHVPALLRSLWTVARNGPLLRVGLAGVLGFSSQFLYIVGAPIFLGELLHQGEQDYWKMFVPMVAGMIAGSWAMGRLSGWISANRIAGIGFAITIVGVVVNLVLAVALPSLPWAVIGLVIMAFGNQLFMSITQLAAMDLMPEHRGAVSSVVTFLQLVIQAVQAGVIAPLVGGSLLQFALGSAAFAVVGVLLWLWHLRAVPQP
ncbi:multidrug effflux MFS transporter [Granulicoccus phenolivorans]|uniref:multidrug effflux MFS transporter n=1 Tax=Granulicoccus phenolivorans TaxID=266854 RepID=UPI000553F84F|nr:multidrug effflux MFS transporter [Granulicoccus phenolivorans]